MLVSLDLPPGVQNHLMYMGFVPPAHVRVLHRSPVGDPTVYSVDGIEIALRRETAKAIRVAEVGATDHPAKSFESVQQPEIEDLVEAIR